MWQGNIKDSKQKSLENLNQVKVLFHLKLGGQERKECQPILREAKYEEWLNFPERIAMLKHINWEKMLHRRKSRAFDYYDARDLWRISVLNKASNTLVKEELAEDKKEFKL